MVHPLTGKKIGAYYGCLLLRPGKILEFDNPENPKILEDFIRAIEKAPAIKPFRYTYLHEEQYRKKAIEVLQSDTKLSEVLQA